MSYALLLAVCAAVALSASTPALWRRCTARIRLVGTAAVAVALLAALIAIVLAAAVATPVRHIATADRLTIQGAVVVAAVLGGSVLVRAAFAVAGIPSDAPDPAPDDDPHPAAPLRGGRLIGALERGAIAAAVLAGFPSGIAIVLAIKGLARYPELRAPHAAVAEQFIIGTFVSVLWALGCVGLVPLLIHSH